MSVSFARSLRRLGGWQQRQVALAIPLAVIKKLLDDGADRLGVQIAYWGFFSVFALLLVFTSILGFVFESNPALQHQLLHSTLERMPVIGPQISGDTGSLTGSGMALAVGLVGALWTGPGVTLAIGTALDRTWDVPQPKRAGFVSSRLRGLLVPVSVGAVNVLATVAGARDRGRGGNGGHAGAELLRLNGDRPGAVRRAVPFAYRSRFSRFSPGPCWRLAAGWRSRPSSMSCSPAGSGRAR
jgi:membrane protein